MKSYQLTIAAISLLCLLLGVVALTSKWATTSIGGTVMDIDQTKRTLTFLTREGEYWTLSVTNPNILTKEQLSKGDQVSIALDRSDRIRKIVKLAE